MQCGAAALSPLDAEALAAVTQARAAQRSARVEAERAMWASVSAFAAKRRVSVAALSTRHALQTPATTLQPSPEA